jgi:hypothetical protein
MVRTEPETFCLNLAIRMSHPVPLLSAGRAIAVRVASE